MNTFSLRLALIASLGLGLVACAPKKEEPPPKPKVSAENEAKRAAAATAAIKLPNIGPAPKWELKDVDGKPVSSEDFKGKILVVDFWATWCGPCQMEIPGYIELVKKYGKDGFAIVGMSIDQAGPEVVKQYMAKAGVNYTMVMADEKVAEAFGGFDAIPTTFLIDRTGQIRDRKTGTEETADYERKIVSLLN